MFRCRSLEEIVSEVNRIIDTDIENSFDAPAEYYFRGEARNFYSPEGSAFGTSFDSLLDRRGLMRYERELYEEALRHHVASFREDTSIIERLARMQHYQLPTRFADLTDNALLAAHFAVEADVSSLRREHEEQDGFIRVIKIDSERIKSYTSDVIIAISHLPLVDAKDINPTQPNGIGQLAYEIKNDRSAFYDEHAWSGIGEELRDDLQHIWPFKPILNSERIRNQGGIFLAFGCGDNKAPLHPTFAPEDYRDKSKPSCGIKQIAYIQIATGAKERIRNELRRFGVSPLRVYPELSNVCQALDDDFMERLKTEG